MFCVFQVGAAFRPNSGECHLEYREENGQVYQEYTKDTIDVSQWVYTLKYVVVVKYLHTSEF